MTFQEAHKNGKNGLVARRGLSEEMLKIRLSNYFSDEEINNIILDVSCCDCWTDGHIVIVQINNGQFIAIANGNYMKLIEP
jgi:hypothetical protein